MSSETYRFVYINAKGEISVRSLVSVSENTEYIQGYCSRSKALRTFRKDRILEYLEANENEEKVLQKYNDNKEEYIQKLNLTQYNKGSYYPRNLNNEDLLEICFTGFKKDLREELSSLAQQHNMFVTKSVTRNLFFLCCGNTAGPSKVERARIQGVIALNEEEFRSFIETGEIPV